MKIFSICQLWCSHICVHIYLLARVGVQRPGAVLGFGGLDQTRYAEPEPWTQVTMDEVALNQLGPLGIMKASSRSSLTRYAQIFGELQQLHASHRPFSFCLNYSVKQVSTTSSCRQGPVDDEHGCDPCKKDIASTFDAPHLVQQNFFLIGVFQSCFQENSPST